MNNKQQIQFIDIEEIQLDNALKRTLLMKTKEIIDYLQNTLPTNNKSTNNTQQQKNTNQQDITTLIDLFNAIKHPTKSGITLMDLNKLSTETNSIIANTTNNHKQPMASDPKVQQNNPDTFHTEDTDMDQKHTPKIKIPYTIISIADLVNEQKLTSKHPNALNLIPYNPYNPKQNIINIIEDKIRSTKTTQSEYESLKQTIELAKTISFKDSYNNKFWPSTTITDNEFLMNQTTKIIKQSLTDSEAFISTIKQDPDLLPNIFTSELKNLIADNETNNKQENEQNPHIIKANNDLMYINYWIENHGITHKSTIKETSTELHKLMKPLSTFSIEIYRDTLLYFTKNTNQTQNQINPTNITVIQTPSTIPIQSPNTYKITTMGDSPTTNPPHKKRKHNENLKDLNKDINKIVTNTNTENLKQQIDTLSPNTHIIRENHDILDDQESIDLKETPTIICTKNNFIKNLQLLGDSNLYYITTSYKLAPNSETKSIHLIHLLKTIQNNTKNDQVINNITILTIEEYLLNKTIHMENISEIIIIPTKIKSIKNNLETYIQKTLIKNPEKPNTLLFKTTNLTQSEMEIANRTGQGNILLNIDSSNNTESDSTNPPKIHIKTQTRKKLKTPPNTKTHKNANKVTKSDKTKKSQNTSPRTDTSNITQPIRNKNNTNSEQQTEHKQITIKPEDIILSEEEKLLLTDLNNTKSTLKTFKSHPQYQDLSKKGYRCPICNILINNITPTNTLKKHLTKDRLENYASLSVTLITDKNYKNKFTLSNSSIKTPKNTKENEFTIEKSIVSQETQNKNLLMQHNDTQQKPKNSTKDNTKAISRSTKLNILKPQTPQNKKSPINLGNLWGLKKTKLRNRQPNKNSPDPQNTHEGQDENKNNKNNTTALSTPKFIKHKKAEEESYKLIASNYIDNHINSGDTTPKSEIHTIIIPDTQNNITTTPTETVPPFLNTDKTITTEHNPSPNMESIPTPNNETITNKTEAPNTESDHASDYENKTLPGKLL